MRAHLWSVWAHCALIGEFTVSKIMSHRFQHSPTLHQLLSSLSNIHKIISNNDRKGSWLWGLFYCPTGDHSRHSITGYIKFLHSLGSEVFPIALMCNPGSLSSDPDDVCKGSPLFRPMSYGNSTRSLQHFLWQKECRNFSPGTVLHSSKLNQHSELWRHRGDLLIFPVQWKVTLSCHVVSLLPIP